MPACFGWRSYSSSKSWRASITSLACMGISFPSSAESCNWLVTSAPSSILPLRRRRRRRLQASLSEWKKKINLYNTHEAMRARIKKETCKLLGVREINKPTKFSFDSVCWEDGESFFDRSHSKRKRSQCSSTLLSALKI